VLIPVSGWMAERFGTRRVYLGALAIFTLASLGCALSTSLPMLVAMRVAQGVGGAMMVPVGRLAVLRSTNKSELVRAIAYLTWPALLAPVVAPAIGGALATYASWRWIFIVNIPLGIAAMVAARRLIPTGVAVSARPLDWKGLTAGAVGISALLIASESVRVEGVAWLRLTIASALAVLATAWAVRHLLRADHPLLDLTVLRVRTFASTASYGSLYRMVITAVPFLLPLMFQLSFGWTAFEAGLMVIALFVGNIAIKPTTTPLMRRFGIRTVLLANSALSVLCFGWLAVLVPGTPTWVIFVALLVSGALRSVGFTAYNTLAFADISGTQLTDANTLHATAQELFGGLGIALGAIAVTVATGFLADADTGRAYSWAFLLLGAVMCVMVLGAARLPKDAGSNVTGR
jgi:EmrB/QacA subfamily drug resistance transporter